ncbi:MAG: acyltransferase [Candidatus Chisholmbacteria bacterium]|nr:acyltransferase [Candidatus Chisholmbacteria bacterium]
MRSPFKDRMNRELGWDEAGDKIVNRGVNYVLDAKISLLWLLGYVPFHSFRRLIFKLAGVTIGRKSTIHIGARFYQPKNVSIGEGTIIGDHATLDGRAPLTIGDHVDIASEVAIYNSEHDIHSEDMRPIEAPVEIGDYVFIGPRAIILPGVKIGTGAVVAAGAVVTKNVPEKTIVGGVPAQEIGQRQISDFKYRLGRFRLFQ